MAENPPLASLLLVSYNSRELLLENLAKHTKYPFEIIVVDNDSKDNTKEAVEKAFPSVTFIANPKNVGYGVANNIAAKHAKGKYLVLLNADAFIEEDAVYEAIKVLETRRDVGLVGGMLVGLNGELQPSARQFPCLKNRLIQRSGFGDKYKKSVFFGSAETSWADPNVPQEVDWVPTAFAVLTHELYDKIGGFDEKLFLYYEDIDLCRKVKNIGLKVLYWPLIKVVHIGGQSSKSDKLLSFEVESALYYHNKHEGSWGVFKYLLAEGGWQFARYLKNSLPSGEKTKKEEAKKIMKELYAHTVRM